MTFEEMNFKEKVEHIFEYYKFHMAVAAGVILLIGSLLNIYLINPAPSVVLDMTVRIESGYFAYDYALELENMINENLIDYPDSQTAVVELLETGEQVSPQVLMASEAKFMGKAEVMELDMVLVDETQFRGMMQQGFFLDIEKLEAEYGITVPEEAKIRSTDPTTSLEGVYVLDAMQFPKLTPLILGDEGNYYLGVFVRTQSHAKVLEAINYFAE